MISSEIQDVSEINVAFKRLTTLSFEKYINERKNKAGSGSEKEVCIFEGENR